MTGAKEGDAPDNQNGTTEATAKEATGITLPGGVAF